MKLSFSFFIKWLFFAILLNAVIFAFAQPTSTINLHADHDLLTKKILEYPEILIELHHYEMDIKKNILLQRENMSKNSQTDSLNDEIKIIPVVFHIIHHGGEENISDEQVLSAIDLLNIDFNKRNSDTISGENTYWKFGSRRANVGIEFRLAKLDPEGLPTTAIVRHEDENAYEVSYPVMAQYAWEPQKYLNIFSVGAITIDGMGEGTVVGMSLFPPTNPLTSLFTDDPMCDGVLIRHDAIGNIGTAVNLAGIGINAENRSLTHELGHYFNLYHPFQNFTEENIYSVMYQGLGLIDGCSETFMGQERLYGDYVDDTPPVAAASQSNGNSCIPVGSVNSCPNDVGEYGDEPDMVENYMDYQWGFCTNMFTLGQLERINETLNGHRKNLWSYDNLIATGVLEGSKINEQQVEVFVNIYPNPTQDLATLTYQLPTASHLRIALYDMLGREIKVLINNHLAAGVHQLSLYKSDVGQSGIYFIKMNIGEQQITKKIIFK